MATNTKNIIDMDGLYRAGYNSAINPENQDKERRVDLIDQLFMKAGGWVIDRYKQNHKELKGLKTLGRASNSQIQMEIEKLGSQLTPTMQASLDLYKKEYDKGARMSVKGMSRKKKQEGQLLMDMAFHKMQTMKKGLVAVQEQMQKQVDNGMIELGEKPFNGTAVTGWNGGATEEEFTNGVRLATGSMLENLSIDDETGEIYYMHQSVVNREDYDKYVEQNTSKQDPNKTGNIIADGPEENVNPYGYESTEDGSGLYSFEEWQELNEGNIEATLFSRIKFPGEEDNTLQDGYMDLLTKHEKAGEEGYEVDENSTRKLEMELQDRFSNANENQIRSFLFAGQVTIIDQDGQLQRVTPAHKLLIDNNYAPGKIDGTAEEQAQYQIFQAKLEELKGEDLSKGSPRRVELVDMVTESVEGYQKNSYNKYLVKEQKALERSNKPSPEKIEKFYHTPGVGNGYTDKGLANDYVKNVKATRSKVKDLRGNTWFWDKSTSAYKHTDEDGNIIMRTKAEMLFEMGLSDYFSTYYNEWSKHDSRRINRSNNEGNDLDDGLDNNNNQFSPPGIIDEKIKNLQNNPNQRIITDDSNLT